MIIEKIIETHQEEFDSPPELIVSVPCPFYLIGEHSWYFKDKTVSVSTTIPIYLAVSYRDDLIVRCSFVQAKEKKRIQLHSLKYRREDRWANAIKATLAGFIENGLESNGLNISIQSDILPSTGLAVKAALKVGTALLLRELYMPSLRKEKLLDYIRQGDSVYYNSKKHLAAVYTALYAQKNTCILTDHANDSFEYIPYPFSNEYSIVITDSRVPRTALWDEADIRTEELEKSLQALKFKRNESYAYDDTDLDINVEFANYSEEMRRRILYIIKEHQCVLDLVDSLQNQKFTGLARSVNRSHEYLRDLYGNTCPEIDWLVKRAQEIDMSQGRGNSSCARITGKGFARCTYTILKKGDVDSYVQKFAEYERIFGFRPAWYVAESAGAARIIHKKSK